MIDPIANGGSPIVDCVVYNKHLKAFEVKTATIAGLQSRGFILPLEKPIGTASSGVCAPGEAIWLADYLHQDEINVSWDVGTDISCLFRVF